MAFAHPSRQDLNASLGVEPSVLALAPSSIPTWAENNPDDLLKFLFVSPQPCDALDRMLAAR